MNKYYYIYFPSNTGRSTLYVGITNNIPVRIIKHRENKKGFAYRYKCFDLMYYEVFEDPSIAIQREKEIKKWSREKKEALIKTINPKFQNLLPEFYASNIF